MGRDMSMETYERIQKLNAEGRRCKLDCCTRRATYVLTMKSVNVKADGSVSEPTTRSAGAPYDQAFCGSCMKKLVRSYEFHGKRIDGNLTYEVAAGSGGAKQVNTLLAVRKLARDERLSA